MIPPTLKPNRRYIAFQIATKARPTDNQVIQAIRHSVLVFLGELGYAKAEFDVVEYDSESRKGVARTTDVMKDQTIAAMTLLNSIQGRKAGLLVLGVSGTVNKARRFLKKTYLKEILLNN